MPTVTRSRQPKIEPVNARAVKAHYVQGKKAGSDHWVMWCIMILMMVFGAAAYHWGQKAFRAAQSSFAVISLCSKGAIPEPVIHCEAGDLDCLTDPTVVEVSKIREVIQAHNAELARSCVSVL